MCFLTTTFRNAPAHPPPPLPVLFDQSLMKYAEIQRGLKRDRDIGRKAVLSDVKTAFSCTPAFNPFTPKGSPFDE